MATNRSISATDLYGHAVTLHIGDTIYSVRCNVAEGDYIRGTSWTRIERYTIAGISPKGDKIAPARGAFNPDDRYRATEALHNFSLPWFVLTAADNTPGTRLAVTEEQAQEALLRSVQYLVRRARQALENAQTLEARVRSSITIAQASGAPLENLTVTHAIEANV